MTSVPCGRGRLVSVAVRPGRSAFDAVADGEDGQAEEDGFRKAGGPLGTEFLSLWHEYEEGVTPEARLVRGVDRLNPALMRLLTGQGWQDVGAHATALDRAQLSRVQVSETLTALYEEARDAAVERALRPAAF